MALYEGYLWRHVVRRQRQRDWDRLNAASMSAFGVDEGRERMQLANLAVDRPLRIVRGRERTPMDDGAFVHFDEVGNLPRDEDGKPYVPGVGIMAGAEEYAKTVGGMPDRWAGNRAGFSIECCVEDCEESGWAFNVHHPDCKFCNLHRPRRLAHAAEAWHPIAPLALMHGARCDLPDCERPRAWWLPNDSPTGPYPYPSRCNHHVPRAVVPGPLGPMPAR